MCENLRIKQFSRIEEVKICNYLKFGAIKSSKGSLQHLLAFVTCSSPRFDLGILGFFLSFKWFEVSFFGSSELNLGNKMVSLVRSCIQSILKLVNSVIGMAGLAMILYAVWMIRYWQRETGELPFGGDSGYPAPWFIYTFLGLGIGVCLITCAGHIAAETANGCCLYLYMLFILLLLMLEAAVTVDVFLNRDWEKDFPKDPVGNFDQFKNFIRSNFEMCKWIGLSIVTVQGLSLLLAMILKALGPHQYYDSDDEYGPDREPLLNNAVYPPPYVVVDPVYGSKK